jgi:signal transduction histidine kinase
MVDLETKYETEKKEIRIVALEKDKKLYAGLGATVVLALLSVIGLLFYRYRSKRKLAEQQIKQLEQEKELIAVRAALDTEKTEREIIARDLHDGVGAMLSVVKNNMTIMKSYSVIENKEADYFNKALDGLDKSIAELRRVAHHIMPAPLAEKGLFVALDDFCRSIPEAEFYSTEQERRFDTEKELVLYRCVYELVNNALRHAKASRIEVHLSMDEETAYLSVVDDGCGFDLQTSPQGMGIKNLHTRLAAFGSRMEIYSEPGKGTEANVELRI